ncbi:hypothetical protein NC651_039179 [Populus alba x Populus x berolinensis]|nr:hypothetical protein NC651_039179 [Populus alba x Populus x berolinensis]
MKFGWLDLFASRMSSYLNVLFTCLERAIGSMDANEDGLLDL